MYSVGFLLLVLLLIPFYFKFPGHMERVHHMNKEIHEHANDHPRGHHHRGFGFFSNPGMVMQVSRNIYLFAFVFALVLLIKIAQKWRRFEKEKMSTELNYLKAQINPHFLFNTLNSVYSLSIEEKAVNTSAAIVKLSGMMRYVTSEALAEKVSLENELDYINSYIELQKIRFGDTVNLNVDLVKVNKPLSIAPLILISFIENAFKYGVNPEENSEINISILLKNTSLQLIVKNNKVKMVDQEVIGSGIGIQNTKNRLDLLYTGKYNLLIDDKEGFYSVNLEINLI